MKPVGNQAIGEETEVSEPRVFKAAVLTISDRSCRGEQEDLSGPVIVERLIAGGIQVDRLQVVQNDYGIVVRTLQNWCKPREELDLIVTTGGTGLSPRDVTPEATLAVVDRLVPGIAETLRAHGIAYSPNAMLCRGVAGTRGTTLIVNLPGNPGAVQQGLEVILQALIYGLEIMGGMRE